MGEEKPTENGELDQPSAVSNASIRNGEASDHIKLEILICNEYLVYFQTYD